MILQKAGPPSGPCRGVFLAPVRHSVDTAESIAPDTPDAEQPPAPSPTSYAAQSEALILHRETCSKPLPWRKPRKWHGPEEVERLIVFCF